MADVFDQGYKKLGAEGSPRQRNYDGKTPPKPTTDDETQDLEIKRTVSVLVGGQRYALLDDDGDLEIRNKLNGMGISIQQNGDIMMLTGSGGNGKACGGRFMVNAKGGGMFKYDGAKVEVIRASDKDPAAKGKKGSKQSKDSGKGELACSSLIYGDTITECHGHVVIKGTNVTIDAADVLSLVGKGSLLLQAGPEGGGDLRINAGQIVETVDTKLTTVSGQEQTIASEELSLQYDPRASKNIISPGHLNVKAKGDMDIGLAGKMRVLVGGVPSTPPLVKDLIDALSVKTLAGQVSLVSANLVNIKASTLIDISSLAGPFTMNAGPGSMSLLSGTAMTVTSGGPLTATAAIGDVNITAKTGNVLVKGKLIYLN
tara:strand:- start:747 stop:1862 length:1116 start_codon:yes stop_codon:yes gene_type:complete